MKEMSYENEDHSVINPKSIWALKRFHPDYIEELSGRIEKDKALYFQRDYFLSEFRSYAHPYKDIRKRGKAINIVDGVNTDELIKNNLFRSTMLYQGKLYICLDFNYLLLSGSYEIVKEVVKRNH